MDGGIGKGHEEQSLLAHHHPLDGAGVAIRVGDRDHHPALAQGQGDGGEELAIGLNRDRAPIDGDGIAGIGDPGDDQLVRGQRHPARGQFDGQIRYRRGHEDRSAVFFIGDHHPQVGNAHIAGRVTHHQAEGVDALLELDLLDKEAMGIDRRRPAIDFDHVMGVGATDQGMGQDDGIVTRGGAVGQVVDPVAATGVAFGQELAL